MAWADASCADAHPWLAQGRALMAEVLPRMRAEPQDPSAIQAIGGQLVRTDARRTSAQRLRRAAMPRSQAATMTTAIFGAFALEDWTGMPS